MDPGQDQILRKLQMRCEQSKLMVRGSGFIRLPPCVRIFSRRKDEKME